VALGGPVELSIIVVYTAPLIVNLQRRCSVKKLLKLSVLAGIVSLASWLSPGVVTPAQAATCPGGYGDCAFLAGKGCSSGRIPCCDGIYQGVCTCSSGHYICAS